MDKEVIKNVLNDFASTLNYEIPEQDWFNNLKELGGRHNFAENNKVYKKNKELYLGHVGDVAAILRLTVSLRAQSPNLYIVMKILGKEEVTRRINNILNI